MPWTGQQCWACNHGGGAPDFVWSNSAAFKPDLAEIGQNLVEIGQPLSSSGQVGRIWPTSGQRFGRGRTNLGRLQAHTGPWQASVGRRISAQGGRSRPPLRPTKLRLKSGRLRPSPADVQEIRRDLGNISLNSELLHKSPSGTLIEQRNTSRSNAQTTATDKPRVRPRDAPMRHPSVRWEETYPPMWRSCSRVMLGIGLLYLLTPQICSLAGSNVAAKRCKSATSGSHAVGGKTQHSAGGTIRMSDHRPLD